jgi:hypothetical protein
MKIGFAAAVATIALLPSLVLAQPIRPDDRLTPGAVDPAATAGDVCRPGYARAHRFVPPEERAAVFMAYGLDPHVRGFEADHRVALELAGTNDPQNLWPEFYDMPWGARVKDALENRVHELVCSGAMTLQAGQAIFLGDWIAGYQRVFGTTEPTPPPAPFVPDPAAFAPHSDAGAPPHADAEQFGVWTNFHGENGLCGMTVAIDADRRLTLRYEPGRTVSFLVQKRGWDVPRTMA